MSREHARDDRGAIVPMVALMMTVLLGIASLGVDLGMQRVVRRDVQAVADVVAMDLARRLDGRTTGTMLADAEFTAAVRQAVDANAGDVLGDTPSVTVALGRLSAGAFVVAGSLTYTPFTAGTGAPTYVQASSVPSVVRVTVAGAVDFAFAPGEGSAARSALAAASSFACYKIGSWAASVDTGRSALIDPVLQQMAMQSGVFANGAQVKALSYTGLAQADVNLNDLAVGLGLGSVSDLATATVGLKNLYTQLKALAQPQNATVVNALEVLRLNASSATTVQMGKLLAADSGASSLLDATANVLDLVGGSVALLNGVNTANVYLASALGSLSYVNLAAKITQGPHQYCGSPGSASTVGVASETQQVGVHIDGTLTPTTVDFVPTAVSSLLGSITSAQITAENHMSLDLAVAGTSSTLKSITCGTPQGVTLSVTNGLATVTLQTPLRAKVRAKLLGISIPPLLNLSVDAVISVNATVTVVAKVSPNGVSDLQITVPPQSFDTPYPTSSGTVSIVSQSRSGASISANVDAGGGSLGAWISLSAGQQTQLLDSILGAGLSQLLSPTDPHSLSTAVFEPLMGLAGARVGGSDVIVDSAPALTCAIPRLVG